MPDYKLPFLPSVLATAAGGLLASKTTSLSTGAAMALAFGIMVPLYILYTCWIYPMYISPLRKVPTVPGFPLWGQFFDIISEEVGLPQRRWHAQYGHIIRYFFPFGAERLSIVDDDALKQMTVRNPYNFPKPMRAKLWMVRILGEGVLLAEDHVHQKQRKALAPGFSIASIRALTPVFWQKSLLLAELWREEFTAEKVQSKTFEVLEWLNRTTLDIIGAAGLGTEIDSLRNPDTPLREAYRLVFAFDISSRILHGLAAFIPMTKYLPAKMNRDMQTSRSIILNKASDIIIEKTQQAKGDASQRGKDIISLIVKDNLKASEKDSLSFEESRDQVMTFLGAGHDTTATSVAWTLHLISKYPEVQSRLRAEIREYMPFLFDPNTRTKSEFLDKADPDQLPYLDNVCRETLRYIPAIPMTVRQNVKPDKLGDYEIPAGTTVYVLAQVINRMPDYWGPTANKFDPDRWDNLPPTYTANACKIPSPRKVAGC